MSVAVGGWLSLIGFIGLSLCVGGWNKSGRGSTLETLSAVGVLVSAAAAVAMIFQGFHLWNTGWNMDLTQMDPSVAGRTAARARGKGGIILLVIQFFHNFWSLVMEVSCGRRLLQSRNSEAPGLAKG